MKSPFADTNGTILDRIATAHIVAHYRKALGLETEYLFAGVSEILYLECPESGLRYFHPWVPGDGKFYERLQQFPWYYQRQKAEYFTAATWTKGKDVLEVGCGAGAFAALSQAGRYVGLELNAGAVAEARAAGFDVRHEELGAYLRHSGGAEVVCSFQVLEHVREPMAFLSECVKACRPGGLIIMSVPAEDSFIGMQEGSLLNLPPHHVTRWPDRALKYAGNKLGLEEVRMVHDQLDDVHLTAYGQVLVARVMDAVTRRKRRMLLPTGFVDRARLSLSWRLSPLVAKLFSDPRLRPVGHSVTMIWRKPSA